MERKNEEELIALHVKKVSNRLTETEELEFRKTFIPSVILILSEYLDEESLYLFANSSTLLHPELTGIFKARLNQNERFSLRLKEWMLVEEYFDTQNDVNKEERWVLKCMIYFYLKLSLSNQSALFLKFGGYPEFEKFLEETRAIEKVTSNN